MLKSRAYQACIYARNNATLFVNREKLLSHNYLI